ncbi:hypothetical protein Tco_0013733 [Tanacetum coccineum]
MADSPGSKQCQNELISSTDQTSGNSFDITIGKMVIKLKLKRGIDFEESFAPLLAWSMVRIFVPTQQAAHKSFPSINGRETAFLNGPLKE